MELVLALGMNQFANFVDFCDFFAKFKHNFDLLDDSFSKPDTLSALV